MVTMMAPFSSGSGLTRRPELDFGAAGRSGFASGCSDDPREALKEKVDSAREYLELVGD